MGLNLPTTASHLAKHFDAAIFGPEGAFVNALSELESAGPGSLCFYASKKYSKALEKLEGGVVFTKPNLVDENLPVTFIVLDKPQHAFAEIARLQKPIPPFKGISPLAVISPQTKIGKNVHIGAHVVIEGNVIIEDDTVIYPQVYIGDGSTIGKQCTLHPKVTILSRTQIGDRVVIFPQTVLGSDGFGFIPSDAGLAEMPQIGRVVIENDVRIGALVSIDRATIGETRIGQGTKIDDHVHIAHNCQIGRNCILCGFVGLSGSVTLGNNVVLAGQVVAKDGVTIEDNVTVGGNSGVAHRLKAGKTYFGMPAIEIKDQIQIMKHLRKLPRLADRMSQLETQQKEKGEQT